MSKHTIQTVVKNYSRYPIDFVWENAQDLEHVGFLHPKTNAEFFLLFHGKSNDSKNEYDTLIYRTRRRLLYFFKIQTFGFRKIISQYNIHQVEYIPFFKTTSSLNSLLIKNNDPEFPTLMKDEIVMEVPFILKKLEHWIKKSLQRHATIQCGEDEPFRERRTELAKRGIKFPFRLYNESAFTRLTRQFAEHLNENHTP